MESGRLLTSSSMWPSSAIRLTPNSQLLWFRVNPYFRTILKNGSKLRSCSSLDDPDIITSSRYCLIFSSFSWFLSSSILRCKTHTAFFVRPKAFLWIDTEHHSFRRQWRVGLLLQGLSDDSRNSSRPWRRNDLELALLEALLCQKRDIHPAQCIDW